VPYLGSVLNQRTLSVLLLAFGIIIGLLSPRLAGAFQPLALPALFLVVVFSLIPFARLPTHELVEIDRGTLRIVAWQMGVLPAIVVAAAVVLRLSDNVIMLLVVAACGGSLFASPALAQMLDLDRKQALQCMLLSTMVTPISLYAFLSILRGSGTVNLNLVDCQ
jgi:predicted permease